MKRFSLFIVPIITLLLPQAAVMAADPATHIFSDNFAAAEEEVQTDAPPSDKIVTFVMQEMLKWNDYGILLYPSDIEDARIGNDFELCTNKVKADGTSPLELPLSISHSSDLLEPENSCGGLKAAINAVIDAEQDIDALGNSLTTIVNGSELATAGEAHRPADVGLQTLLVNRVWSSSGSRVLPWPGSTDPAVTSPADQAMQDLDAALSAAPDLDETVWRFHYGFFRDQNEADPALSSFGTDVKDKLQALADVLHITGDPTKIGKGEYVTPKLSTPNVSVWARSDDLGIQWTVPNHLVHIGALQPAGNYPEWNKTVGIGDVLAYPFDYQGTPAPTKYLSPLCSRTAGRLGYLCRPVEPTPENCDNPNSQNITLVRCSIDSHRTRKGPEICPGIQALFKDTGSVPLDDPDHPGELNPALTPADTAKICEPQNRVLYKDDIMSHACYVAFCVAQSHSGHTLVTNRNGIAVNEMTSPYLGCLRQDPQLGLYAELSQVTPVALPPYIGHELVQRFEQEYCGKSVKPSIGVAGYCTYQDNRRANVPLDTLANTAISLSKEAAGVDLDQAIFQGEGMIIGQRLAEEQSAPVITKEIESLANNVLQTANLLQELRNAPLTITPCPWTGQFPQNHENVPPPTL